MGTPLQDLRVLDMSRVVAGPFAARMLSDLGADVVKLEPPEGDLSRVWGESRHGLSGFFTQQNAGKRNICVDLRAEGAVDVVLALAGVCDIVIENFRPDVLPRLGLGWDVLRAANPRLILLSINGFGATGASAGRLAYAPVVHAESGLISRQAAFDDAPATDPMLSIGDTNAGLHGLVGLLAALHMRERTGVGQHVEIAMIDAMLATDDYSHHALDDSPVVRLGGLIWDAPGGPILIAGVLRNTWRIVSTVHGVRDPSPAGADLDTKIRCRTEAIGAWTSSFAERAVLIAALEKAGLAWSDVRTASEAFARRPEAVAEVDDRGGGRRRVVQSPYRFSDASSGLTDPAAHRGEHNASALADWLGWDASRIEALRSAGVLLGHR